MSRYGLIAGDGREALSGHVKNVITSCGRGQPQLARIVRTYQRGGSLAKAERRHSCKRRGHCYRHPNRKALQRVLIRQPVLGDRLWLRRERRGVARK
jgi:hypothetical protein